jgi:beta-phosphoglucomutase
VTVESMRAAIFDLDGVIVDTAKYHYLAWKRLANEFGFDFTEADNERLKGVSRGRSLEILLEIGGRTMAPAEREAAATRKNDWYVDYIRHMSPSELLPGSIEYIGFLRNKGVKIALASASKNAPLILERLGIPRLFDAVVDGTCVSAAKPDPEVFVRAGTDLGVPAGECVVFEDAEAGIEAARRAGMRTVGVGKPANLSAADLVITSFEHLLALSRISG